jgi:uncharacterized protein (DUF58 family)
VKVFGRKRRLPRQLKTTREGKLLIAITLGLGFGAVNSGNNLLYLVLGMLLSMIVISGVLSELTLRGITVRRRYGGTTHAGRETFLSLEIRNGKGRLSSFSVEVEELLDAEEKSESDDAVAQQRPAYALNLRAGEVQNVALKCTFARRGVFRSQGLRIATRFPFSFFRKSREILEPFEFVVFPEVYDVNPPQLGYRSLGAAESDRRIGRGGDYHGLREHRIEDDPRDIHWKSSARLGRLVSREYERSADRRLWLLTSNVTPELQDSTARDVVESAISETASLASHYTGAGWSVGLKTADGQVPPGTGTGQLTAILVHLARADVHAGGHHDLTVPSNRGERLLVRHPAQARHSGVSIGGAWDRVHESDPRPARTNRGV